MAATELPAFICMAAPNKEIIHARGWHAVAASSSCYWRDDHWRATKPPLIICMVAMNHARGWHALAASSSFHWRIRLEMIIGGLGSHLRSFAWFQ
eukprot:scaffold9395_cov133-Chaetoceros_neogracile.AAC.1